MKETMLRDQFYGLIMETIKQHVQNESDVQKVINDFNERLDQGLVNIFADVWIQLSAAIATIVDKVETDAE